MIVNICNVELEIFDKENGIVVSGGADSALLLYFLLKFSKNKIHIFTLCNKVKGTESPKCAIDVVFKCAELTGNYNLNHHISYISTNFSPEQLFSLPTKTITNGLIYTGITANPPYNESKNFFENDLNYVLERDPSKFRPTLVENFYMPWTNIDKKKINEIYHHYNLLDSLFPLTRSCETLDTISEKHCGNCWWCHERQWGFGKL